MASADGSIVITTEVDDKKANRELDKLTKKIEKLEQSLASDQAKKSGIQKDLEAAKQAAGETINTVERLKKELASAQNAISGVTPTDPASYISALERQKKLTTELKEQESILQQQDKDVQRLDAQYTKLTDKAMQEAEALERAKDQAGELHQKMASAGPSSEKMAKSIEKAQKSATRFSLRLREVIRSALVFTLISQGLASFRSWLGKVIKSNDEASAATNRLKAALLTMAQPLVDVIIPAFTKFVNILTSVVMLTAKMLSAMFGKTLEESKELAENLNQETEAIEGTGDAAKKASKSLASFDEINKLSGGANQSKENQVGSPDFEGLGEQSKWLEGMMNKVAAWVPVAMLLGGIALVAIGASIGSLPLVAAGLLLLAYGGTLASDNEELQSWVDKLGLDSVQEFVVLAIMLGGIAMVAIGAMTGNILLVVAGLLLIGAAVVYAQSSGMLEDWAEKLGLSKAAQYVTAALLIAGFALVCIGAAKGNILMVISGLTLLAVGIYVGTQSGVISDWAKKLGLDSALDYVAAALQVAGFALICIGAAKGSILAVIAGAALLGVGIVLDVVDEQTLTAWCEKLQLTTVMQWITVALMLAGITMIAIGAATANMILLLVGAGLLGVGLALGERNDTLKSWVETLGLDQVIGWVSVALMLVGIGLVGVGLSIGNIFAFLAGAAMLLGGLAIGAESGTFGSWVEALHLQEVAGWVSTAMLLAGIAMVAIGATTTNIGLIMAGLALLGGGTALKMGSNSLKRGSGFSKAALASMPSISSYPIPALASGAVIPPNREFLAVLGDQTRGTNIEAPISEIEAAVARGIQRAGGTGGGDTTVILEVDRQVLGRVTYRANQAESRRVGVELVEV